MKKSPLITSSKAKGNIHDLIGKGGYYWGEISQKNAKIFLSDAKKIGWDKAAFRIGLANSGFYEYVASYSRADWVFDCVDFTKHKKVLDIGSGWGAITFSLSLLFDEVWSLEAVRERLQFQVIRAKQEERNNINFVRSDWLKLPFKNNSFDVICINGVLEWIGLSDLNKVPSGVQKDFLKEVKRVLRPDGCVYIGIENRFAAFYFLGALDHSGLPFTSLLPRSISDIIVRKYRKTEKDFSDETRVDIKWNDYRTYTYSYWGYQRLLKDTDLKNNKIYWSLAYNSPTDAGRFDGESFSFLLKLFRKHDFNATFLSRFATRFGANLPSQLIKFIFPIFAPSFLIYAYNSKNKNATFESELINRVNSSFSKKKTTSYIRKSGTHGLTSKINYIFLDHGKPFAIAKTARFTQYAEFVKKEEGLLSKYGKIDVKVKKVQGKDVFIEPYLDLETCQTFNYQHNKAAIDWLLEFQKQTKSSFWKKSEIEKEIESLVKFLDSIDLPKGKYLRLRKNLINLKEKLISSRIPIVSEHGDFVKTNLLIDNKNCVSVVDWEFYKSQSFPFFDFIFFLINNSMVEDVRNGFESNFTGQGKYSETIRKLWKRFLKYYPNIDEKLLFESITFCLVKALERRVNDKTKRHLDMKVYDLLLSWDRFNKKTKTWLKI